VIRDNGLLQNFLNVSRKIERDAQSGFLYEIKEGVIRLEYSYVTDVFFLEQELGEFPINDGVATVSQSIVGSNAFVNLTLRAADEEALLNLQKCLNLASPAKYIKRIIAMIAMIDIVNDNQMAKKLEEFYYMSGGDLDLIEEIEEYLKKYRPHLFGK
jgi:hypothetical protein